MAVGKRPFMFIDVRDSLINNFLEIYAQSIPTGLESAYICEKANKSKFRLFFDVDITECKSAKSMDCFRVVEILQRVLEAKRVRSRVLVCGEEGEGNQREICSNFHLRCPDAVVNVGEALEIRREFVRFLAEELKSYPWHKVVDESVYTHLTLRMLFARKCTKGIDVGRAYGLWFAFDTASSRDIAMEDAYRKDSLLLLKDASIHALKS